MHPANQLAVSAANRARISHCSCRSVNRVFGVLIEALERGERVEVRGLGVFRPVRRPESRQVWSAGFRASTRLRGRLAAWVAAGGVPVLGRST